MGLLRDLVHSTSACSPLLPLTHTTTVTSLSSVLSQRRIATAHCPIFRRNSLYLFYGRPDYRPIVSGTSHSITGNKPATLVIHPRVRFSYVSICPFDTGAFFKNRFEDYLGTMTPTEANTALTDRFALYLSQDSPAKAVTLFYTNNRNYIESTWAPLVPLNTCIDAMTYKDLATSSTSRKFDSRNSGIEIQVADYIPCSSANVLLAIIPEDSLPVMERGLTSLGIPLMTYPKCGMTTNWQYMGMVQTRLHDYLKTNGYF